MKDMTIGQGNIFEAACTIMTSDIGDFNEFGNKSVVDDNCRIGNLCMIGPMVSIPHGTRLANNIVVFDDSRSLVNEDMTVEIKKPKMKELCQILGI